MKLPRSYNDITIEQYQEIYPLLKSRPSVEQWITVIAKLSGHSEDYYMDMPVRDLKRVIFKLQFLLSPELNTKVKRYALINGRIYKAVYKANELTTAQGIDLKEFQKPTPGQSVQDRVIENAHYMLASIYLPLSWKGFKYNSSKHQQASNDFKKARLGDVFGTLFFYSVVYEQLMIAIEASGKEALEVISPHMEKVLEWARNNPSGSTGGGS